MRHRWNAWGFCDCGARRLPRKPRPGNRRFLYLDAQERRVMGFRPPPCTRRKKTRRRMEQLTLAFPTDREPHGQKTA